MNIGIGSSVVGGRWTAGTYVYSQAITIRCGYVINPRIPVSASLSVDEITQHPHAHPAASLVLRLIFWCHDWSLQQDHVGSC